MKIFVLFVILIPLQSWGSKLVLIHHVTLSQKSFMADIGVDDGVLFGQKSLFTSDNYSFVAKAVKVNRFHSVWVPQESEFMVPFKQGDFVVYENNMEGIYKEIPELKLEYERLLRQQKEFIAKRDLFHQYSFLFSTITNIEESSSLAKEDVRSTRIGQHFTLFYNIRPERKIILSAGFRYDKESLKINDPPLSIPVSRYLGMTRLAYCLYDDYHPGDYFYYFSAEFGYGFSHSQISSTSTKGVVALMPKLAVGVQLRFIEQTSLSLELGAEYLKTREQFTDEVEQTVNVMNATFTAGFSF